MSIFSPAIYHVIDDPFIQIVALFLIAVIAFFILDYWIEKKITPKLYPDGWDDDKYADEVEHNSHFW